MIAVKELAVVGGGSCRGNGNDIEIVVAVVVLVMDVRVTERRVAVVLSCT